MRRSSQYQLMYMSPVILVKMELSTIISGLEMTMMWARSRNPDVRRLKRVVKNAGSHEPDIDVYSLN